MIILNDPYVSEFLIETIKQNNLEVLDNEVSRKYFPQKELISTKDAVDLYKNKGALFYTNSENSIDWINKNLKNSKLYMMISLCKDKSLFRQGIKSIFPDYYFEEFTKKELKKINSSSLKFPLVLKLNTGFLSFGVYPVRDEKEWKQTLERLEVEIKKFKGIFPSSVVNTSKYLVEEMIEGKEYAVDAYFDENSLSTILNIFEHPFSGEGNVSDRIYYTSKPIIKKYLPIIQQMLDRIGTVCGFTNFPFHLELRITKDGIAIPIEINPLRFCGWCITDIAYHAWGINVYEYFFKSLKPDWEKILSQKDDDYVYFTMADIPKEVNRKEIKSVNYNKYLKNISNPLDVRKVDYKNNPVFGIIFGKTHEKKEIDNILKLDMKEFIRI